MGRDYYAELGVSREATRDELAAAFRKLAAKYHPDRHPGDAAAEERFKRIAEAYQVLSDPKARAVFDRGGEEEVRQDPGFKGFGSSEEIFSHFADLFGTRRARRGTFRSFSDGWEQIVEIAPDEPVAVSQYRTTIDVFTAMLGGTIEFPLEGRRVEMRIPAGTQPGQVFRLRGQGREGTDAHVRVDVEIPRTLTPEQRRLLREAMGVRQ